VTDFDLETDFTDEAFVGLEAHGLVYDPNDDDDACDTFGHLSPGEQARLDWITTRQLEIKRQGPLVGQRRTEYESLDAEWLEIYWRYDVSEDHPGNEAIRVANERARQHGCPSTPWHARRVGLCVRDVRPPLEAPWGDNGGSC